MKQPFQYVSFEAKSMDFALGKTGFDIYMGDQVLGWEWDPLQKEEKAFFEKMMVPGIVGHINYNIDDLWWITFWDVKGNRAGWWRVMDDGSHQFKEREEKEWYD